MSDKQHLTDVDIEEQIAAHIFDTVECSEGDAQQLGKDVYSMVQLNSVAERNSALLCSQSGRHLTECDDDGYCNFCGHQTEIRWVVVVDGLAGEWSVQGPWEDYDYAVVVADRVHGTIHPICR